MEPKTQVVSGLCFCLILHKETLLSQTSLVLGLKAELASYSSLTSSQFCGEKEKDFISSPNLPGPNLPGKNTDWPISVKCWMTICPSLPETEEVPRTWDFQF